MKKNENNRGGENIETWIKQFFTGVVAMTLLLVSFWLIPPYLLDDSGEDHNIPPCERPDLSDYIVVEDIVSDSKMNSTLFTKTDNKGTSVRLVGHYSLGNVASPEFRIYFKSGTALFTVKDENAACTVNEVASGPTEFCKYVSYVCSTSENPGEYSTGAFSIECKYFGQGSADTFTIMFAIGSDYGTDGLPGSACTKTVRTYTLGPSN